MHGSVAWLLLIARHALRRLGCLDALMVVLVTSSCGGSGTAADGASDRSNDVATEPRDERACADSELCISACAIRERVDPTPCGEAICKPDELCVTDRPGLDTGQPFPQYCVAGPERTCAAGQDCCYRYCYLPWSVTIDLGERTMVCNGI